MPIPRVNLADATLRALKPPPKGRIELQDTLVPKLFVRLTAKGVMTFSIVTRTREGRKVRPTLGRWPDLSLAEARRKAKDTLAEVATGADPTAARKAARLARAAREGRPTVTQRLAEWQTAKRGAWKPRYAAEIERLAAKVIIPKLGARALEDVRRADWTDLVAEVRFKGTPRASSASGTGTGASARRRARPRRAAPGTASWLYGTVSAFLSHAEAAGWIDAHPLPRKGLAKLAPKVASRERVLADAELTALWRASAGRAAKTGELGEPRSAKSRAFIRLLLLTGARTGELAGIAVGEIDRDAGLWNVPGARTKNSRARSIPLPELALAELDAVWPADPGVGGGYRLLGATAGGGFAGFSGLKARLDRDLGSYGDKLAPWRWHDLRRSTRTGLARLGARDDIAELAIGHVSRLGGLRGVYDRHDYADEVLAALRLWQDHVAGLLAGDNVVPFSRVAR